MIESFDGGNPTETSDISIMMLVRTFSTLDAIGAWVGCLPPEREYVGAWAIAITILFGFPGRHLHSLPRFFNQYVRKVV